jgi:dihydropteroate synthase
MTTSKYKFFKQTEKIQETLKSSYDPLKEWRPDPKGYFLIRINHKTKQIEVGLANYKHIITKQIIGHYAIEIYHTIIKHNLINKLEHAAYLGKELYKAELALKYNLPYKQEFPLQFTKEKVKVRLEKES